MIIYYVIVELIKIILDKCANIIKEVVRIVLIEANEFIYGVLTSLECSDRINVYIGVTGILVAIVIFIAEVISNNKHEIYKKLILKRTDIIKNVKLMMAILLMMWISNIIKKETKLLYCIIQLSINLLILYSMYKTLKIFIMAIKLNTNEKYLNEQLDIYVKDEILLYKEKSKNKRKKQEDSNKSFYKYTNNSNIFKYSKYMIDMDENYRILYPNEEGYIKNYDYGILDYIANYTKIQINTSDKIKESKIKDGNLEKPEVFFCKKIGEKIDGRTPIAYYKNLDNDLVNNIKKAVITDKIETDRVENITKIIDDLFKLSKEDIFNFDNNHKLLNLYESLCEDNNEDILKIFMTKTEEEYFEACKNIKYNKGYSRFLVRLLHTSFKYNKHSDFTIFNSYITGLYYRRMREKNVDFKAVAYDYANHIFNISFYSIKRKKDYQYYDNVMSNLLNIINWFVRFKKIDAINVLFNNIHFEDVNYKYDREMSEYDIVKFQFLIGFIYIILYSYNRLDEKNLKELKEIITKIRYKFLYFHEIWEVIKNFKKYSKKKSEINKQIDNLEFYSEEKQYQNLYFLDHIDILEVLKCFLYMFNIRWSDIESIDRNDIERNDRFEFERIITLFKENHEYINIERIFDFEKYDISKVEEVLNKAVSIANEKEEQYKREAQLIEEKVKEFKRIVIENSKIKNGILEVLYDAGKVKYSNYKLKKVFGINQLIPRNLFFEEMHGVETIAIDYGKAFPRGINKELIETIESYSEYTKENLNTILNRINELDNYVLIMNSSQYYKLNFETEENYLKINDKKIRVVRNNNTNKIIIINKRSLPQIEYCKFDDIYNQKNIYDNLYYELTDCSKDPELIKNIIKSTDWIKEKGDETEQINYLRQQCNFKVYMSYQILKPTEINSIIIDTEN